MIIYRNAEYTDMPKINDILNYAIKNTNYNLNTKPRSQENANIWFEEHKKEGYPVIVAEKDSKVIGFASLSHFRFSSGYDTTAEVSVYVENSLQKNGIGKELLNRLEALARVGNYRCLMAVITSDNIASIKLHQSCAFKTDCTLKEVALKNNSYIDVVFMSKLLK